MNKSDIIKAFAKLEGIELTPHRNVQLCKLRNLCKGDISINGVQYGVYDPILDLALNYTAIIDHKVSKITEKYPCGKVMDTFHIFGSHRVSTTNESEIPRSVIECILKSQGVYNES